MKNSTVLKNKMNGLSEGEELNLNYLNSKFIIKCFHEYENGEKSFSIRGSLSGYRDTKTMNIKKITNTFLSLYDFGMLNNRIDAKMRIADIEI